MSMKHKNHYVPRRIMKEFSYENKISMYNKKDNSIQTDISFDTQCQKRNFYSKKTLEQLKLEFPHQEINPIFQNSKLDIEDNLELYVEEPFYEVLQIINSEILSEIVNLDINQINIIKRYAFIQHLRTTKFKEDMTQIDEEIIKLPDDFIDQIKNIALTVEIDIRQLIREDYPQKNNRERRDLENKFNKFKKKNPNYKIELAQKYDEMGYLEKAKRESEEYLESLKTNVNKHSAEIMSEKNEVYFLDITQINSKNMIFLKNNSKLPFVISDVGIAFGQKTPEGTNPLELDIYIPINPKTCIVFTNQKEKGIYVIDEDEVISINKLLLDECRNCIFSSDSEYLTKIKSS